MLREAGVEFEIVPGMTAGVAAPAYAGIPVTHRELASGVAFVTGHEDPDKPESALDWAALARFPGTLVFYMGVRALPRIAERLQAEGRPAGEPVAVIERGTLPGQRTVVATLADVAARAEAERIRAPAVTVVGPVAALREDLAWLERRPLHGRTVAVTRARAQASPLAARLRELGATVIEAPAIRTVSLAADLPDLSGYDGLVATSPNGVHELFARLLDSGRDARSLAGLHVAAMGPGTARAFGEHGIAPDTVPERSVAEGLVEALADVPLERVLIARAREGRDVLIEALRDRGAHVDVLALYETLPEPLDADAVAAVSGAPTTSPSPRPRPSATCSAPRARRRWPGRGWPRSGRPRARSCARTASRPTSRPTRTRPTGSLRRCSPTWEAEAWPRSITFLSDYGLRDEFVGVVHAVIAHECPDRAGRRPLPRRAAPVRPRRCADARAGAPLRDAGRASRGRRPRRGRAAAGDRAADRRGGPAAGRAGQRAADPRRHALRRDRRGGRDLALAVAPGAGVGDVPRPRPVRARSPPGSRAARRWRTPGRRSSRASSSRWTCRSRGRRTERWSRT